MELLIQEGADVDYNDPYVPQMTKMQKYDFKKSSASLTLETLNRYDCVVISTDHSCYDYQVIAEHASLVVDTRNAMKGLLQNGNVVKA